MYKQSGLPANALHRHLQAGQILLIIILVTIVASTIGLSLASKSIINLRTSTEEAESQKALAAAEAGIERAIQGSIPVAVQGSNPSNNSNYETQVDQVDSSGFLINGGNVIPKDEGADVWFVGHDNNNIPIYSEAKSAQFFNLYWGSASEACGTSTAPAAIEAIAVSRNSTGEIKSYRYAYDSCNRGNNFTQAESGSFPKDYNGDGKIDITFTNRTPSSDLAKNISDIVFIRIIPIYKDAVIGVSACNYGGENCTILPIQGYKITSTGTSGQANRKLNVFKGWPQTYLPYLSYGLFVAN